jgi:hypothetical protein
MDQNTAGVNDDELNQMIANLQGGTPPTPPAVTSNTGAPLAPPAAVPTDAVSPVAASPAPATPLPATDIPIVSPGINTDLESIKHDALNELRPLVDKLDLSPEDKFDTLLLLIRSTDDSSLVAAAHAAAMQITDETRRAQALLDIIKEIDFFGQNTK